MRGGGGSGRRLQDEDFDDVVDVALIWWREEDGDTQDLADLLTDALTTLEDGGLIWVLAPKAGRAGHALPAEIEESATTAGLHLTSTLAAAPGMVGLPAHLPRSRQVIDAGRPAPPFRLPDTNGTPVDLRDLTGGPVLVMFLPAGSPRLLGRVRGAGADGGTGCSCGRPGGRDRL